MARTSCKAFDDPILTSTTDFIELNNCEFKLTIVEIPVFVDDNPEYKVVLSDPFN